MKILNISSLYPPNVIGGAEQAVASLASGLRNMGHDIEVLTLGEPSSPSKKYEINGVKVTTLALKNIYWPFSTGPKCKSKPNNFLRLLWHILDISNRQMASAVINEIKIKKPDVVLTHNFQGFSTAIWPAIRKLGIPVVHTLHDFSLLCPRTILYKNGKNCEHGGDRCTDCRMLSSVKFLHSQAITEIVGVSGAVVSLHQKHGLFKEIPVHVIHNSIQDSQLPNLRDRAPSLTSLEEGKVRVAKFGYLGRILKSKGFEVLLKALSRFPQATVELMVAGVMDDEYREELRQKYDLKNVTFLGFIKPEILFNQIDVLIFPSEALEALGNGVFEAYFHGLPVIGSNMGGIPEMIDEGLTGCVFPSGDDASLYQKMKLFVDDVELATSMKVQVIKKAEQFLLKDRVARYEEVIAGLVDVRAKQFQAEI